MNSTISWHELGEPEGKGWPAAQTDRRYDRFPARAQEVVPPEVWGLSHDASSLYSRFRTNATSISARWTLGSSALAMPHMTAAGCSGLDLYGTDTIGRRRWVGMAPPTEFPTTTAVFNADLDGADRTYTVYFPLFNQLEGIEIGVPAEASFELIEPDPAPPVVYYGTSIVHGASASRPGMSLPALLGRRLAPPIIGLGFSGRGRMEIALAELIGEIEATVYLLDCVPNMEPEMTAERTVPFIRALRQLRPDTPILMIGDRTYTNAWATPIRQRRNIDGRQAYRAAFDQLRAAGDINLHYLSGEDLLGDDDEGTIDCSHPTDLGFFRMAEILAPVVEKLAAH